MNFIYIKYTFAEIAWLEGISSSRYVILEVIIQSIEKITLKHQINCLFRYDGWRESPQLKQVSLTQFIHINICKFFQQKYTTKSDVWSFGICFWEILNFAGIRPYSEIPDLAVLSSMEAGTLKPLPIPRNCNKDLYELMLECWNFDDNLRPSFREIHLFLQRKNLGFSPSSRGNQKTH